MGLGCVMICRGGLVVQRMRLNKGYPMGLIRGSGVGDKSQCFDGVGGGATHWGSLAPIDYVCPLRHQQQ